MRMLTGATQQLVMCVPVHVAIVYRPAHGTMYRCVDVCCLGSQADSTLPVEQRRNYKGVGDAFVR